MDSIASLNSVLTGNLESPSVSALKTMVEKWPWCVPARMAFVKKLQQENHPDFQAELEILAVHSPDNRKLYQWIHPEKVEEPETKPVEEPLPQDLEDSKLPESAEEILPEDEQEPIESLPVWEPVPDISHLLGEKVENDLEPAIENFKPESAVETADKPPEIEEKPIIPPLKEEDTGLTQKTFLDWLKSGRGEFLSKTEKAEPAKAKKPTGESAPTAATQEAAQKSIELKDELITETFAKILVAQKKFKSAIHAYEKLSLKNPEKSVYFAALIEELKKKL